MMQAKSEHGFTLIELLIVVAIIGIVSSIAVHAVFRARLAANETSAIGTLRSVISGQMAFQTSCGSGLYSVSITDLVNDRYLSPDVQMSPKDGYNTKLVASTGSTSGVDCASRPTRTSYYVTAVPISPRYGIRGFATGPGGTIWQDVTGAAPAEPFTQTPDVTPIQ